MVKGKLPEIMRNKDSILATLHSCAKRVHRRLYTIPVIAITEMWIQNLTVNKKDRFFSSI